MNNTNFSLLGQLEIPSYEKRFDDISLYDIFSSEEIEKYSLKKVTSLAIMSDIEPQSDIPAYNHLHFILVSVTDVKFNKYLYEMYKKVTAYCGGISVVIFEKNGALKFGVCEAVSFENKSSPRFGQIVFTQWIYEDFITENVYSFFYDLNQFLNSGYCVEDIYSEFFLLFQTIQPEFLSEEQVYQLLKTYAKKKKYSSLFNDYVLSTSFATYRQTEGYEPRLKYEKSSVLRAGEKFVA